MIPSNNTPPSTRGNQTAYGCFSDKATTAPSPSATPRPISTHEAATTNRRACPFHASHPSKPPRHPSTPPPIPPTMPAARSDHQALDDAIPMLAKLPVYSTSLTGPRKTVPCAGRKMLISSRVGEPLPPVLSNGSIKARQCDVPLSFPISPPTPSVLLKYWPSGIPDWSGGKKFHISR